MIDLSLILPVHNEAEGIGEAIGEAAAVLNKFRNYEIICVENGSTDNSYEVIREISRLNSKVRVIRSQTGWGNAVRAGIGASAGRLTCFMVSDRQIEAKTIIRLYELYRNNTDRRTVLWKVWRTSRENNSRLANSRIYNVLARLLYGLDSKDINATPKLMETELLKSVRLTSDNIAVDLELMLELKKRGLAWVEVPVQSKKRITGSSTTRLKSVAEMLLWMIRFKAKRH
jgi:glycosyltransferase involved in cell wall biosynthesis